MLRAPSYVDKAFRGIFENKRKKRHVLRPQAQGGTMLHAPSYVDEAPHGLFENKKKKRHVLRPQS